MGAVHLAHDVLDAQLVDHVQEKIGRVDALLLELEEGRPPRVATIVIGGAARAERVGRWFVVVRRALRTLFGQREEHVSRIPFDKVRRIGGTIELDVDEKSLDSEHLERWLKDHVVCRIPGAGGDHK
jgi:sporulation protein YlmC with PRC-barrel domain